MLFPTFLFLAFMAVFVAAHEGHHDGAGNHSVVVYTTEMVMGGKTTIMEMTATVGGNSSVPSPTAPSSIASPGVARMTSVPVQM